MAETPPVASSPLETCAHSQILTRMTASEGFLHMPLVGTRETDTRSVDLLTQWIISLPR